MYTCQIFVLLRLVLLARRFLFLCFLYVPLRLQQLLLRWHVHTHQIMHILLQQTLA